MYEYPVGAVSPQEIAINYNAYRGKYVGVAGVLRHSGDPGLPFFFLEGDDPQSLNTGEEILAVYFLGSATREHDDVLRAATDSCLDEPVVVTGIIGHRNAGIPAMQFVTEIHFEPPTKNTLASCYTLSTGLEGISEDTG
ncbi:MAG: hypothetical protein AAGF35_10625 [Pseudomonadota bacterium]